MALNGMFVEAASVTADQQWRTDTSAEWSDGPIDLGAMRFQPTQIVEVRDRPAVPDIQPWGPDDRSDAALRSGRWEVAPGAAASADTPTQIARFLTERGFGKSRMTVLSSMGGKDEQRFDATAESWNHTVPAFNTLAVDCIAAPDAALLPRVPGLPDAMFQSDGTMTKQEVRAATLAKLMPMRGALLWDIGCGSGSVAIEWMRGARYTRAIGIEPRPDRRAMAAANALALGTPRLELIDGTVPQALTGLDAPDAIFIGGGLSVETFNAAWAALRPLGRLVANAVTLESEAILLELHKKHGGDLVKLSVARAEPVGPRTGWRPAMPVTQWSLVKR